MLFLFPLYVSDAGRSSVSNNLIEVKKRSNSKQTSFSRMDEVNFLQLLLRKYMVTESTDYYWVPSSVNVKIIRLDVSALHLIQIFIPRFIVFIDICFKLDLPLNLTMHLSIDWRGISLRAASNIYLKNVQYLAVVKIYL